MRACITGLTIAMLAMASACSLTPTQQRWTTVAATVLIVGAVAAHQADHGGPASVTAVTDPSLPCRPQPDGSCR